VGLAIATLCEALDAGLGEVRDVAPANTAAAASTAATAIRILVM
jgi:hypothetical protein